jgi:hypothetical protein
LASRCRSVEVRDLLDLGVNVDGDQAFRLLRLDRCDAATLFIDFGGHLRVDGIPGRGDLRLLVANGRFSTGDLGLLSGQLGLKTLSGDFDQRRRQRFRQLDLRSARWAGQGWFGHGSCLGIRAQIVQGTGCPGRKFAR